MDPIDSATTCSGSCEASRLLEANLDELRPLGLSPHLTTDPAVHHELAHDLRRRGQREPLMVVGRPVVDTVRYWIVDGERRYHAAELAGCQRLIVRVHDDLNQDTATLYETAALVNLQRGTLTAYEETGALLQMLAYELADRCDWPWTVNALEDDREATAGLLKAWVGARSPKRRKALLMTDSFEGLPSPDLDEAIEHVFNAARRKPTSFVKNLLPLLDLTDDVLDAHQRGALPYTAALVINKVDDADRRAELINAAVDGASVSQLRQMGQPPRPAAPTVPAALSSIERECHDLVQEALPLLQQLPPLTHNDATSVLASLSKTVRTIQAAANASSAHHHD